MQADVGRQPTTVTAYFIYAVRHGYSDTVIHSDNQLRIIPREGEGQSEADTEVWSIPSGRGVEFKDRFGNQVRRLRVIETHSNFIVAAGGRVSLSTEYPSEEDARIEDLWQQRDALEFRGLSPLVDPETVANAARDVAGDNDSLLNTVNAVVGWVYENIVYRRGNTTVATKANQVLENGKGVCQDKTHLALGMLRSLGVPCRYTSGLIAGESGETHSWLEFLHPRNGWLGADPTRGMMLRPCSDYIKFAVGRDYTDVSPVTGSFLSKGAAVDVAAIADVQFHERQASLEDAMEMLDDAFVVRNGPELTASPNDRPENDY